MIAKFVKEKLEWWIQELSVNKNDLPKQDIEVVLMQATGGHLTI